jgi:hypothetical protein
MSTCQTHNPHRIKLIPLPEYDGEMNSIKNKKTALLTGANSGFGFEVTKTLLREEWQAIALIRSDMPQADDEIDRCAAQQLLANLSGRRERLQAAQVDSCHCEIEGGPSRRSIQQRRGGSAAGCTVS